MGRPREFDIDDLLEKVMLAFLESGLEGISMRHLEQATGVSNAERDPSAMSSTCGR